MKQTNEEINQHNDGRKLGFSNQLRKDLANHLSKLFSNNHLNIAEKNAIFLVYSEKAPQDIFTTEISKKVYKKLGDIYNKAVEKFLTDCKEKGLSETRPEIEKKAKILFVSVLEKIVNTENNLYNNPEPTQIKKIQVNEHVFNEIPKNIFIPLDKLREKYANAAATLFYQIEYEDTPNEVKNNAIAAHKGLISRSDLSKESAVLYYKIDNYISDFVAANCPNNALKKNSENFFKALCIGRFNDDINNHAIIEKKYKELANAFLELKLEEGEPQYYILGDDHS